MRDWLGCCAAASLKASNLGAVGAIWGSLVAERLALLCSMCSQHCLIPDKKPPAPCSIANEMFLLRRAFYRTHVKKNILGCILVKAQHKGSALGSGSWLISRNHALPWWHVATCSVSVRPAPVLESSGTRPRYCHEQHPTDVQSEAVTLLS